jgi:hypothetical protein
MNIAKDGWYTELGSMWPGQGLSLKVQEVLYTGKSQFQVGVPAADWLRLQLWCSVIAV